MAGKRGAVRGGTQLATVLPLLAARIDAHFQAYSAGHITRGKTPGPDDVVMSSNDYLSLGRDKRIVEAQIRSLENHDTDIYMSGVYVQFLAAQTAFERKMADFLDVESTALCQSGFCANEGLVQAIANEQVPVYLDMFAHASLLQGTVSARAKARLFRHNSPEHLRSLVGRYGPGVVAVDAIYSTLGDVCALADIVAVCEEGGCTLVVDESHAIGVRGDNGQGLVAELGLADRVPFRVFSLSKALVGRGGIVAGSSRFIEYFRYESRPAVFSSAVLPWEIARFSKTLEIVRRESWRRTKLHESAQFLRDGLREIGYNTSPSETQIIPLVAGPEARTARLRDALESNGIFGSVFCAPATPKNKSLVRLCVNQGLSGYELERVLEVCAKIRDRVQLSEW
jgi:CAI-1 autoinducer synthase